MVRNAFRDTSEKQTSRKGKLAEAYIIGDKLGRGEFAVVLKVQRKSDGKFFAAKVIKKRNFKPETMRKVHAEVSILARMRHPNINRLVETMNTKKHIHMVLELLEGDQLFESIVEKKRYTELEAANIIRQVTRACEYMHERCIIHRDLKPENLVYLDKKNTQICITDFGLAKLVQSKDGLMETTCGTPGYVAPEILRKKKYDSKVDLWSIGVILYILLSGFPPFTNSNRLALYNLIKSGKYSFPSPYWDHITQDAKACISRLMQVDSKKRLSATSLLEHEWISSKFTNSTENLVRGGYDHRFKRFVLLNKLRRGVDTVLFLNRLRRTLKISDEEKVEKNEMDTVETQ